MIAVVVPAHNEAQHIAACVRSLQAASRCAALKGEAVKIIVALDDCSDDTGAIARGLGALTVETHARNVGIARATGARLALQLGARWLAFTDADSTVAPDWFGAQLELRCDAVCGTITVQDWGSYGEQIQRQHRETYTDADGHRHIHGANLGVSAQAYRGVGGFRPLRWNEDVDLVQALQTSGASIAWSARPRVITSARRDHRALGGFGAALRRVEHDMLNPQPAAASSGGSASRNGARAWE